MSIDSVGIIFFPFALGEWGGDAPRLVLLIYK